MELGAIIVASVHGPGLESGKNGHAGSGSECFAAVPLGVVDILGRPVVERVADRLRRGGIEAVTEIRAGHETGTQGKEAECRPAAELWRAAEDAFRGYADEGVEDVLVLRIGPYAEFDVADLLCYHRERRAAATLLSDGEGPLDGALVRTARRQEASFLFRNGFRGLRQPSEAYRIRGYSNRLQNARDLRRLALDGLLMRCEVRPHGRELKPGVWVGEQARIHASARVLAPAFVGAHAKLRAATVVTRGSAVEHHAVIDHDTVLEDTTVLPYTYMGGGLDVTHAVAGCGRIAHLPRNAEVEIADPRLLGNVAVAAWWRTMRSAVSLASYLPVQAVRGFMGRGRRPTSGATAQPEEGLPPASRRPPATLEPSPEAIRASNQERQFAEEFAVVRRYGNE